LPVTSNGPAIEPVSRPFASVEAVRFLDRAAEYRREKGGLDEQIEVAGAGGIEPPNGGIKISLIIQRFQRAFGKIGENSR
jgi:hypothetical protein